jgi:ubiquinone/menaquinone biosynthesis C-methylase UbiE
MSSAAKSVTPDWGVVGHYEDIAAGLLPMAENVIKQAKIQPGERVLDVGARNGNAAILAAKAGGKVTAVDFSPRLLEVTKQRAADEHLDVTVVKAEVESLPLPDASFDVLIDIVSLIFVGDQEAAVSEMARVTAPGGRIFWTGWTPNGAVVEVVKLKNAAAAEVLGHPPYPYTKWNDRDAMANLWGKYGFDIELEEYPMSYTAPSPQAFMEGLTHSHPISIGVNDVLAKAGKLEPSNAEVLKVLEDRNEDSSAFKVSFSYIIGTARRRADKANSL